MSAHLNAESYAGIGIASAAVLELLGIPLQPVVWALIGGVIGAGWAPQQTRWWASVGVYVSSSLISALVGHATAAQLSGGSMLVGNAIATGVAIFFHPLLAAGAQRVPAFIDGLLSLIGRKGSPP